jgi:hypothetical protein
MYFVVIKIQCEKKSMQTQERTYNSKGDFFIFGDEQTINIKNIYKEVKKKENKSECLLNV